MARIATSPVQWRAMGIVASTPADPGPGSQDRRPVPSRTGARPSRSKILSLRKGHPSKCRLDHFPRFWVFANLGCRKFLGNFGNERIGEGWAREGIAVV